MWHRKGLIQRYLRSLRYILEASGFYSAYFLFRLLPLKQASKCGAWLGRALGPLSKDHRIALQGLQRIYPNLPAAQYQTMTQSIWREWGSVAAEYAHLPQFLYDSSLCTIKGKEILEALRHSDKGAIFVSGHLSNFQLIAVAAAQMDLPLVQMYRPARNPFVDRQMLMLQKKVTRDVIPKNAASPRRLFQALKAGERVLILVDQKYYEGVSVPFMGYPALTNPAAAVFARRFQCPLIPVRVRRIANVHFEIQFFDAIDTMEDDVNVMTQVNHIIGQWVYENPTQWLWIHNRW